MEAALVLEVLEQRLATAPGGRDVEGRPLIVVSAPGEPTTYSKDHLDTTLRYLTSIYSAETRRGGLTALVDATKTGGGSGGWRPARACARQVAAALGADAAFVLLLRPDAFWDKPGVDVCTRREPHAQVVTLPLSRLHKYVDDTQLPADLGGTWPYDHHVWLQSRVRAETLGNDAEETVVSLESLVRRLENTDGGLLMRDARKAVLEDAEQTLLAGEDFLHRWQESQPQAADADDGRSKLSRQLEMVRARRGRLEVVWATLEAADLEAGVSRVTAWILGPAEAKLNAQQNVGASVAATERLRQEHEALELLCRETYGQYAELLHRIDSMALCPDDLRSQRDFMDFACRSFASRLERRRNVLITAQRFFRLVDEYLERTGETLEALDRNNAQLERHLGEAEASLRTLEEEQENLGQLERESVREGERLADLLAMPVKDALGRPVAVDHAAAIAHVQRLLELMAQRAIGFGDRVTRHRLALRQAALVGSYEADAAQAVAWLRQLRGAMRAHVGCGVGEIQGQKERHLAFQQTAKGTYEYGRQLLVAAEALRASCRLSLEPNGALASSLNDAWRQLDGAAQEHMTRLRVSAVFHRTVDQHCTQLRELLTQAAEEAATCRRGKVLRLLASRERLLLEVGRMVRLGRLLRTRLREPLSLGQDTAETNEGNATAVEAISERLSEVAELAERLDAALCGGDAHMRRLLDTEGWCPGLKPPNSGEEENRSEDDFVTASECTCTRSSSFHTASECGAASPWWEEEESPSQVVRISTETTQNIVVHEVTETRTLKMSHSPSLGLTSFHMNHERVETNDPKRSCESPSSNESGSDKNKIITVTKAEGSSEINTEGELELESGLKEVSTPERGYHPTIARHAVKSIL